MLHPLWQFEQLSMLYRAHLMDPWWRWYSQEPGPRRALALFAGQYAFERQGRDPSYPHAAYFAIDGSATLDAADMWRSFQQELRGAKANPRLNPLNHSALRCTCIRCTFTGPDGGLEDIVETVRAHVAGGRVRHAFERVDLVRGIGPKISSFFLRDLAVWFDIEPAVDRELLQPIDIWVRRAARPLSGSATELTDKQTARWICENSIAPEAANQGLWYFAALIAASEVRLRRALADTQYASRLVDEYIQRLRGAVAAWSGP